MQNRPVVQSITVHPLRPRFNSSPIRFVPATAFKALSSFSSPLLLLHASTCLRECVLSKRERERERLKVRVSWSFTQRDVLFELLHFDYSNSARGKRMQPLRWLNPLPGCYRVSRILEERVEITSAFCFVVCSTVTTVLMKAECRCFKEKMFRIVSKQFPNFLAV